MNTEKIPVIAVDDEPLALQLITGYIRKSPFLDLRKDFENPVEAMEFLNEEPVELVFLDIHMPDLTGTQMARMLLNGPKIIFTTAYANYALEGYRLNAVDYLLKPFTYEDFLQAAQKARRIIEFERKEAARPESAGDFLFLKSEYKVRRINFNEVLYIEGLKDYVKVFLKGKPNLYCLIYPEEY
jgi:DNA-binding LytR/AlgR family response regulator